MNKLIKFSLVLSLVFNIYAQHPDVGGAEDAEAGSCQLCTEFRANPCDTCGGGDVAYTDYSQYPNPVYPYPGAPRLKCVPCDCGNGIKDFGEGCDDGNNIPFDGCNAVCIPEICGDGIVQTKNNQGINEQCDSGDGNANTPNSCRTNCQLPKCGDSIVDPALGEQCDGTSFDPAITKPANIPQSIWNSRTCNPAGSANECKYVVIPFCGDGVANNDEQCDGSSFAAGLVKPANVPQSIWDSKTCNPVGHPNQCKYKLKGFCGDGVANAEEQCDGTSFYPELERPVGIPDAIWDAKTCNAAGTPNQCKYILPPYCGDNIANGTEQCDGTSFAAGLVKPADVPQSVWDAKTCNAKGTTNECKYKLNNYCGDGALGAGEQCDGTLFDPTLVKPANVPQSVWDAKTCGAKGTPNECKYKLGDYCGDNIANGTEQCDGTSFAAGLVKPADVPQSVWDAKTCNAVGTPNECKYKLNNYCGDGALGAGEQCDGTLFDPTLVKPANVPQSVWDAKTCNPVGTPNACKYKLGDYCGDNIANGTEQCDGTSFAAGLVKPAEVPQSVWDAKTCGAKGTPNECKYKLNNYCGDGALGAGEQCDGTLFDSTLVKPVDVPQSVWDAKTCNAKGTPNECKYKLNDFCGNGVVGAGEQCDGAAFDPTLVKPANVPQSIWDSKTCNPVGHPNQCKYKLKGFCGDGVANAEEQCDGTSFYPELERPVGIPDAIWDAKTCNAAGTPNECKYILPPYCGDNIANGTEQCDGTSFAAGLVKPADVPQSVWDAKTCNAKGTTNECKYKLNNYCGDGALGAGEQCDGTLFDPTLVKPANVPQSVWDAKTCNAKGTPNQCKYTLNNFCGDGTLGAGEQCDGTTFDPTLVKPADVPQSVWDAKTCNAAGTPNACKYKLNEYCGDNVANGTEQCDGTSFAAGLVKPANVPQSVWDAKTCNPVGTPNACKYKLGDYCGDGVLCTGEECDEGVNNGTPGSTCSTSCKLPRCGDGILNGNEKCDGTLFDPTLVKPANVPQAVWDAKTCNPVGTPDQCNYKLGMYCGDGSVCTGEDCDDGNTIDNDECSNTCQRPCKFFRLKLDLNNQVGENIFQTEGFDPAKFSCLNNFMGLGTDILNKKKKVCPYPNQADATVYQKCLSEGYYEDDAIYINFFRVLVGLTPLTPSQLSNGSQFRKAYEDLIAAVGDSGNTKVDDLFTNSINAMNGVGTISETGIYFDESCQPRYDNVDNNKVCGKLNFGVINTPVSLLMDNTELDQNWEVVKFKQADGKDQWMVWKASASAPLLVIDNAQNGKINDVTQLFGSWTFGGKSNAIKNVSINSAEKLTSWKDGFEAMATLDQNSDGNLTEQELKGLALWFDKNSNAISEAGEVISLKDYGISRLSVNVDGVDTNEPYIKSGYDLVKNGQLKSGKMVDWKTKVFNSKEEALFELTGVITAPAKNPEAEMVAKNAEVKTKINGIWHWTIEDKNLGNQPVNGFMTLWEDGGKIAGYSWTQDLIDPQASQGLKTALTKSNLTGSVEGGVFKFTIKDSTGKQTNSEFKLTDSNTIQGLSTTTVNREIGKGTLQYKWKAERMDLSKFVSAQPS